MDPIVRQAAAPAEALPRQRTAVLMCEGSCRRPTTHDFVANRGAGHLGSYEARYACGGCKTERRYGLFG